MAIHPNCHLIAVAGGKGGVGKSVFAANLACALMTEMRAKTLLIDADSKSCGDQNVITGVRPNKTLEEISKFTGSISPQTLPTLVASHPSGLSYIAAVHGPEQNLNVDTVMFKRQLIAMSGHYRFIIADLGNDLTEFQMSLIE
ncbi:MAG: AAA family ATPase, partial [Bdellovibrionales bacterium]|nr:AAA family ATPase [Bdellovibrionales bacterium]